MKAVFRSYLQLVGFLNVCELECYWTFLFSSTTSELRHFYSQEPAPAGRVPGGAAEVGEPVGQEDSQKASTPRTVRTLLTADLHEGSAQPVHEEAQSTAPHQQEQVDKKADFM